MVKRDRKEMIGLYLRVSTNRQDVRTQRHALQEYCKRQLYPDAELVTYVDDGVSGTKAERPALSRLLKDVEGGRIDRVVVFELSRLHRDLMELLRFMERLDDLDVVLETPKDGPIPFDNTLQRFIVAAKALVDAEEREAISRRTRDALAERKAAGVRLGAKPGEQRRLGKMKDYANDEPELVAKVITLRRKRLSMKAIAVATDVSAAKVRRILRRCNASQ
jgi:putative DNA-invertase from lambdoid prophage Rac